MENLLEQLIRDYGYLAILIGTFFEGETILVLGGWAAHSGYLELHWVIMSGFVGSCSGDQLFFFIGRFKGKAFLEKRPKWKARAERVDKYLENYERAIALTFRFFYGLRNIIPFVLGMSNIPTKVFIALNFIGAIIWAITLGVLGFLFGQTVEWFIAYVGRWILLALLAAVIMWFVINKLRGGNHNGQADSADA